MRGITRLVDSADQYFRTLTKQLTSNSTSAARIASTSPDVKELAKTSFDTILDADVHLDNKASRILGAIAFLTAAAAAVFARA